MVPDNPGRQGDAHLIQRTAQFVWRREGNNLYAAYTLQLPFVMLTIRYQIHILEHSNQAVLLRIELYL